MFTSRQDVGCYVESGADQKRLNNTMLTSRRLYYADNKCCFDGTHFKPMEPIPVEGKYEVIITFTKPLVPIELVPIEAKDTKRQRILKHFGTWDDEDVKMINEIVAERANFSKNRDEI